eukprot:gene10114-434_t
MEATLHFLVQVDKLINLLESPVFTYIRLSLLEPAQHPFLIKMLYGILMILPQSKAYHDLEQRLKPVETLSSVHSIINAKGGQEEVKAALQLIRPSLTPTQKNQRDMKKLLKQFLDVQIQLDQYRQNQMDAAATQPLRLTQVS